MQYFQELLEAEHCRQMKSEEEIDRYLNIIYPLLTSSEMLVREITRSRFEFSLSCNNF